MMYAASKPDSIKKMFDEIVEHYGTCDVLVNNAGITRDTLVLRMKPEQWQDVIDINLSGVFYCSQAFFKIASKKRTGRIINMSSVVGKVEIRELFSSAVVVIADIMFWIHVTGSFVLRNAAMLHFMFTPKSNWESEKRSNIAQFCSCNQLTNMSFNISYCDTQVRLVTLVKPTTQPPRPVCLV